jgi:hypothetical protein
MSHLLRCKLREFGLNPRQWIVEIRARVSDSYVCDIWPVEDLGIVFRGRARGSTWLELRAEEI